MPKMNFYYDESEHSREIGLNTLTANNYYDNFITTIIGWKEEDAKKIEDNYRAFELKYEQRKSKGEIKSTTLKNNQLKFGFASLNKDNVTFLSDYLSLFSDDIYIYFSVISKIEYVINQLFCDYHNSLLVDIEAFKYSIIKALVIDKPIEVEEAIFQGPQKFVDAIRCFLKERIALDQKDPILKQREIVAYQNALIILDDVQPPRCFSWDYRSPFVGFQKFLAEMSFSDYSLTIDREGEKQNTVNAAKAVGLKNVTDAYSHDSFGIRMTDMLAGLIGKMMKSLCKSLHPSERGSVRKIVLSTEWFNLTEAQLQLYKKFFYIICKLNHAWYKSYCGIYSDDIISLNSLLNYMNHFSSIEEIKKDLSMQGEYFNAYTCHSLEEYYSRMRSKLSVDPIRKDELERGFFFNQRGAKCYIDVNKQPKLPLREGGNKYLVLSVGNHQNGTPLVTIEQNGKAYCYRLPDELGKWAFDLTALANMGENMFPTEVLFAKMGGHVFAEIL